MVGCLAGCRVGEGSIVLKERGDSVEQGFLGLVVLGAELSGTLEHQMLQVMCQTRGLGRVVLRTCAYGNVGLDAWLFLVDSHGHCQSVLQLVGLDVHRIARHGLEAVASIAAACYQQNDAAYEHRAGKEFADSFVHGVFDVVIF